MENIDLNFIDQHYPSGVRDPSTPYVYFKTLLDTESGSYIYNAVTPYFSSHLTTNNIGNFSDIDTVSIDAAFSFLKSAIQTEYAKEMSFINSLNTLLKSDTQKLPVEIPSTQEDWSNFIEIIQDAITQSGHGLESLKNEFSRLKHNHDKREQSIQERGQDIVQGQQDQIARMTNYMERLERFLNEKSTTKGSDNADEIYGMILSKYGAELLNINNNGTPELNRSQVLAVIQGISAIVLRDYVTIHYNDAYKGLNWQDFQKLLDDPALDSQIISFISRAKNLPFVTQDLMDSLGIINDNYHNEKTAKDYVQLIAQIQQGERTHKSLMNIGKQFQNNYSNRKNILDPKAFKLTKVANVYAEVLSLINFSMSSGSVYSANTGSSGAKPDNLLAVLNIDLSKLNLQNEQDREIYAEVVKIREELESLNKSLSSSNTAEYYKSQKANWDKAEKRINESLKKLSEKYDFLVNCFIIEDSTKNYLQLEAGAKYDKVSNAFHGGSLGANITDQLAKISAFQSVGAISMIDAKWLLAAIINSGPGMIAESKKNYLEQYLAMFATILLFDDQLNIAAEAIKNMAKDKSSATNVKKIHMFSLNNGYYPLSYVLQLTYNNLYQGYTTLLSDLKTQSGVLVEISGYVKNPGQEENDDKSKANWETTRQAALSSTKLKIQFMVNFLGTLNTLLPK